MERTHYILELVLQKIAKWQPFLRALFLLQNIAYHLFPSTIARWRLRIAIVHMQHVQYGGPTANVDENKQPCVVGLGRGMRSTEYLSVFHFISLHVHSSLCTLKTGRRNKNQANSDCSSSVILFKLTWRKQSLLVPYVAHFSQRAETTR